MMAEGLPHEFNENGICVHCRGGDKGVKTAHCTARHFLTAENAREYISYFSETFIPGMKVLYTDFGNYDLNHLSDEDAIRVANMLWRDVEQPAIKGQTKQ